jgi:2-octaprenyl-6-methoxyphenol hydroxylase
MTGDIAIIGTGLSGMTLAVALAQENFNVTLIGDHPAEQDDLRTTAVLHPHVEFLKTLDLWKSAAVQATPLITMELVDGVQTNTFEASEIGMNEFGFNVRNIDLQQDLVRRIEAAKNIRWLKTTATRAERTAKGWSVTCADGKTIDTTLMIGADGRNSFVRKTCAIPIEEKEERQAALVTVVGIAKNHHFTSTEWYRAGGPFTTVPMPDKKLAIVWCDPEDILRDAVAKPSGIPATIFDITEGRYGQITLVGKTQIWPVRPMMARRLINAHAALIGEAAHTLPPIGAQGFNTTLGDLICLIKNLSRGRSLGLSVYDPAVLARYETTRLNAIRSRYHGFTRLNDLIRVQNPAVQLLRRFSLKTLQLLPPVKAGLMRATMRQAS